MTWFNRDYKYKKSITINHNKIAADESNFPVLISITDNDLRDTANGGNVESNNGYDIIFYDSAGNLLFHEIESYINTTGTLVYWVKVLSISSTNDTDIWIYYGKFGVTVDPSSTDVWDANFVLVQHLKEITGTHHDSTNKDNDGVSVDGVNQNATGQIDGADEFIRATGSYVHVNYDSSLDLTTEGTIEMWIKIKTVTPSIDVCLNKGDSVLGGDQAYSIMPIDLDHMAFVIVDSGAVTHRVISLGTTTLNTWYHVVSVWNASGLYIYMDGNFDNVLAETHIARTTAGGLNIGAFSVDWYPPPFTDMFKNFPFDGFIDEVRISNIARNADWIKTSFTNQDDPGSFYSLGNQLAYVNYTYPLDVIEDNQKYSSENVDNAYNVVKDKQKYFIEKVE